MALLPAMVFAQSTFSVSNIPGVTTDYYTLQGAVDSVPAGSTLLVFPSAISYGDVKIAKKLSVYGTGFMLDQNAEPFTATASSGAIVNNIVFKPGSDNSLIQSLQFIDATVTSTVGNRIKMDSVHDITISRCNIYMHGYAPPLIATANTFNCMFTGCYIVPRQPIAGFDQSGGALYSETADGSTNLLFINNIFDNRGANGLAISMNYNVPYDKLGTVFFINNTFAMGLQGANFCNYFYSNNIFYDTYQQPFTAQSINMTGPAYNNITNATTLFTANSGNSINANTDSLFTNKTFGFHSFDQRWQVVAGSFAKTFASDGGEAGAFGGKTPYVLSGIPSLPQAYAVTIKNDTTQRGHVLVRIKAKASN